MEDLNFDVLAERYISQMGEKESYTRGDMETCFVSGCQDAQQLQPGMTGTFGQAIGSLKHGFLVAREGWNGKGMFLFLRPFDSLKDDFIIDTVKSLPYNFKQWVKNHPNEPKERFFTETHLHEGCRRHHRQWLVGLADRYALMRLGIGCS